VLGGALLFLFGRPRLASAHAVLIRSDPGQNARLSAQPANVDLFFSEPLNHSFSTVQVRNTSGQRLDKRDVHFTSDPTEMVVTVPQIDPGYYTVTWTTVSAADGHRLDGAYPFTVLNPDGSAPSGAPAVAVSSSGGTTGVQPFDAVLRWLLLLGIIGVTGGFGFAAMVLYPAANELPGDEQRRARGDALWLLGAVVPAAVLVVVVMNVAVLVRQAEQNGSLSAISGLLSGSTGTYWIAREVLALIAGGIAWWLARKETRPGDLLVRVLLGVGLVIGLAIVLTGSLTSHAAATAGSDWSVPIDFLHVAAVSLWLGSLAQLPALLRMRRGLAGRSRSLFLGTALRHFSTVAFCCVGVVLFSGIFNGLVQVPNWGTLTGTSYGRTLIVKLVLLAPLLALAVWNGLRVARRFEQAALARDADSGPWADRLARNAVLESVAGAAVIAVTAILVFLVPAKDAQAQSLATRSASQSAPVSSVYRNQAPAGDITASMTVSPNRVGENDFKVLLSGPDVDKVERVQLRFQSENQPVGGSAVDANAVPGTPGLYDATAANFSFVGRWRVTVNVRRTGHDDANGAFTVEVPDATGATTTNTIATSRSATIFPAHGITEEQFWGCLLLGVAVLGFVFRRRLWAWSPALGTAGVLGVSGAVVIGVAVVIMGRNTTRQIANVQNPVPADQRSVESGKQLYMANCAVCHGNTGHGDGPGAAALNPKPLDLTVHVGLHPDAQLYDWVTNGIPRTSMPPWKTKLSDTQRWDLLNYLRTLSAGP